MWTITWSWQAPGRIAAMAAAEGGMVISSGLDLFMLEVDSTVRWQIELPFKAHAVCSEWRGGCACSAWILCHLNKRWFDA